MHMFWTITIMLLQATCFTARAQSHAPRKILVHVFRAKQPLRNGGVGATVAASMFAVAQAMLAATQQPPQENNTNNNQQVAVIGAAMLQGAYNVAQAIIAEDAACPHCGRHHRRLPINLESRLPIWTSGSREIILQYVDALNYQIS